MDENTRKHIEELVADRQKFNDFIYTPVEEAITELKRRQSNKSKKETVLTKHGVPLAILFRPIATPNHETRRFISIADATDLKPVILEYLQDRFTSINELKYYLGKLTFYRGQDKTGKSRTENKSIIDFNISNGKPINELITHWGQSLADFHHDFFHSHFPDLKDNVADLSEWLHTNGENAELYYKKFFMLILEHGILFENFLLDAKEIEFTKNIILPAFMEVIKETGMKPLVVALEPTDIEGEEFWLSHRYEDRKYIFDKINKKA